MILQPEYSAPAQISGERVLPTFENSAGMREAMDLMKQVEKTTPNDWEKQSENIIDDLLNLIITRHAKNFTADELLRFLNYTLQFRPKYLIGAGQSRLRTVL